MSVFLPELERQLREAIRQRSTQGTANAREVGPRGQERSPAGALDPGVASSPRREDPDRVAAVSSRVRLPVSLGGVVSVLAAASAVVIAVLAIAVTSHGGSHGARAARTGTTQAVTRHGHGYGASTTPTGTNQAGSLDAQLRNGIHPLAPAAALKLPILGRQGTEDLADLRGKVVVVNLFASWCTPCAAEESLLEQTEMDIAGQNATILGITYFDAARPSEKFVNSHGITYPVLRDVRRKFGRAYGATGIPATYVINRQGRITAIRRYEITRRWLRHALTALGISSTAPKAPSQHISLAEIESGLTCVACHKPLELAHGPQAVAERTYIRSLIAKGETKPRIDATLVKAYGPAVLAKNRTPQPSP